MPDEKNHIRCKTIIEVLGKPKEHVENTIKEYVDKISSDSDLIILKKEFADVKEQDKFFSTFVELEIIIRGIPKLIDFCFNYMPSSIEILKPEKFTIPNTTVQNLLNDLQARLHNLDMVVKQQKSENDFLKRNLNNMFRNIILLALTKRAMNKSDISKITGIIETEIETYLKKLEDENLLKKEGDIYSLGENAITKKQD